MNCVTCNNEMVKKEIFWCPKCGTIISKDKFFTPRLVLRVNVLIDTIEAQLQNTKGCIKND